MGDFDGDGVLDLLCQQMPSEDGCSSVFVAWLQLKEGRPVVSSKDESFH